MRKDTENPEGNDLPPGCKEEALLSAIEESGYPFQGQVAYKLKEHFHVTEEWGYVDSSTKEHRSLDIFGYRLLNENKKAAVQPRCAVLVECKQSRHPYVFFRRVTDRLIPDFPAIASVPHDIMISQMVGDSSERSTMIHASQVLGLDQVPFVHTGPPICAF